MFKKIVFILAVIGILFFITNFRASGSVVSEPWGAILAQLKRIEAALLDISSQKERQNEVAAVNTEEQKLGEQSRFGTGFFLGRCALTEATTTMRYIGGAQDATSTPLMCDIDGADMIDLNILYTASSSTSTLTWIVDFSTNGGDWYGEDGKTIDSNILTTHGRSQKLHSWTSGSTATSSKNIGIEPLAAKKMRVHFQAQNDNGKVWAEIVKREQFRR